MRVDSESGASQSEQRCANTGMMSFTNPQPLLVWVCITKPLRVVVQPLRIIMKLFRITMKPLRITMKPLRVVIQCFVTVFVCVCNCVCVCVCACVCVCVCVCCLGNADRSPPPHPLGARRVVLCLWAPPTTADSCHRNHYHLSITFTRTPPSTANRKW